NTVTTSTALVTLSINSQPGSGASLACTGGLSTTASAGVATFGGCQITGTAGTYTLTAASSGLTGATSTSFLISGVPSKVVFTTQPGGGSNGTAWTNQPVVTVEDSSGNTVTTSTALVTLSINSQPGSGASLACTGGLSTTASAGVATFSGCQIIGSAGSYTLTATSSGLTSDTSSSLTITAGAASQLVFTTQPGGDASGTNWTSQPVVTFEDSGGNTVSITPRPSVTLSINTQPGSGATLTCASNTVKESGGVSTFSGCSITGTAGSYTLTATGSGGSGLTGTSGTFAITPGSASKLVFTTQPGGGARGTVWSTQPVVTVEDSAGNTVTSPNVSVTLTISSAPFSSGTLSPTSAVTTTSGVAIFSGCKITGGQSGNYTLTAAASGLTSATSNSFSLS
ncbi:MAG TPA: hypothetical protein VHZ02_12380, partial [Acidimicrobiales bacterium]|nr:hypothetical protein [Acidimicrobiales bacterium]